MKKLAVLILALLVVSLTGCVSEKEEKCIIHPPNPGTEYIQDDTLLTPYYAYLGYTPVGAETRIYRTSALPYNVKVYARALCEPSECCQWGLSQEGTYDGTTFDFTGSPVPPPPPDNEGRFGATETECAHPGGHADNQGNNPVSFNTIRYSGDLTVDADTNLYSPEYDGIATKIVVVYYPGSQETTPAYMKCALYGSGGNIIAETEEETLPETGTDYVEVEFDFTTTVNVYADQSYIIAQWFDGTGADYTFLDVVSNNRYNYGCLHDYTESSFKDYLCLEDDYNFRWRGWTLLNYCVYEY